jgi:hypothetical protein
VMHVDWTVNAAAAMIPREKAFVPQPFGPD